MNNYQTNPNVKPDGSCPQNSFYVGCQSNGVPSYMCDEADGHRSVEEACSNVSESGCPSSSVRGCPWNKVLVAEATQELIQSGATSVQAACIMNKVTAKFSPAQSADPKNHNEILAIMKSCGFFNPPGPPGPSPSSKCSSNNECINNQWCNNGMCQNPPDNWTREFYNFSLQQIGNKCIVNNIAKKYPRPSSISQKDPSVRPVIQDIMAKCLNNTLPDPGPPSFDTQKKQGGSPKPSSSHTGLWIGLGIGGGVLLLILFLYYKYRQLRGIQGQGIGYKY